MKLTRSVQALRIPAIILSALLLTACASTKQIEISASPIEKPPLTLPNATKVSMRDVKWIVVNKDNIDTVLADLSKNGGNIVMFALTDKGYEALSLNTADLRQLIMQQQAIIAGYEQYYQSSQAALDKANSEINGVNDKAKQAAEPKKSWLPFGG